MRLVIITAIQRTFTTSSSLNLSALVYKASPTDMDLEATFALILLNLNLLFTIFNLISPSQAIP